MGFNVGGALSGASTGFSMSGGNPIGAAVGGLAGGFLGGDSGGGDIYSSEDMLPGHSKMALANLRGMLSNDPYNARTGQGGYFAKEFDYWGEGKVDKWRDQLLGAAKEASNPILKAVADQVEADFARRGLTTGGAAGAAKARAMIDTAARIVLPVEQQIVGIEQGGVQGKYGLQQYAMNLALGGNTPTLGGMMQSPYSVGPVDAFLSNAGGISKGMGSIMGALGGGGGIAPGNESLGGMQDRLNNAARVRGEYA